MNITFIALAIWISFLVLMGTGMPVAFSMLITGVFGYLIFVGPTALSNVGNIAFSVFNTELYVAIPLYVIMAQLLVVSGIASDLYTVMYKWMGGLRGGLAIGTVVIATILGATTGLVATATVTMGMLAYPEMQKRGYDKTISIGTILAGGALGLLIPPSLTMILVGSLTGLSVGKLFIAGLVPGLMCSFLFIVFAYVMCLIDPKKGPAIPVNERASWNDKFTSLAKLIPPLIIILVVLGGIWFGVFTATEAGGIGAACSLIYCVITGKLTVKSVKEACDSSLRTTSMVMFIAVGGTLFTSLNGITGTTKFISGMLSGLPVTPFTMLMIMMFIVLLLGMFMDLLAIAMICLPVMMPIVFNIGVDPLYFGFLFAMALIVGTVSPPFGYTIFYFMGLGHKDVKIGEVYKAAIIYSLIIAFVLLLCVIWPDIAMKLPSMMIKG